MPHTPSWEGAYRVGRWEFLICTAIVMVACTGGTDKSGDGDDDPSPTPTTQTETTEPGSGTDPLDIYLGEVRLLLDTCVSGDDMAACTSLRTYAPEESAIAEVSSSCGGRATSPAD